MDAEQLVSEVLGVSAARITPDLQFAAVPEWDSLNHVNLMLALEERLGTEIDAEQMIELTSVQAIRDYIAAHEGL